MIYSFGVMVPIGTDKNFNYFKNIEMNEKAKPCNCQDEVEGGCTSCKIGKIAGYLFMLAVIGLIGYGVVWTYKKLDKKAA